MRSHGAYFGVSPDPAGPTIDPIFLSLIVGGDLELRSEGFDSFDEEKSAIRRFLVCKSALVVDVESAALLASFEETLVVDLFPIPFRRALNLRLVAFMVVIW